ncbi:MAG: metallophosphoesterase, partial [Propionibacteriaceae bacterium]
MCVVGAALLSVGLTVSPAEARDWNPTVTTTRRSAAPDTRFSIAVMPDTQQEVLKPADTRFIDRNRWLVANRDNLDLRFVTHTGDVVNWDTPDHAQTIVASKAMVPLEQAHIPYSLSIGNHDTQATTVGGGARDLDHTPEQQRDTHVFNAYFTAARYGAVGGAFEAGKVDNIYSTFSAGQREWLVLNLELWPRTAAVNWARSVVAAHPDANVIVATHSYLNPNGTIYSGADYGDNSPQYLYDHLIKVYPNVRMVFSGHAGVAGKRTDVGVHGNKIVSYLQTLHSNTTNPVRLVEIDTATGSLSTRIYGPKGNVTFPQYDDQQSG